MLWRAPAIRRDPSLAIPAASHAACSAINAPLKLLVLPQPAPALVQPLAAVARNRLGLGLALGVQRLLGLAQHACGDRRRAQPLGQLVAARLAEELVFGRVSRAASSRISRAICS